MFVFFFCLLKRLCRGLWDPARIAKTADLLGRAACDGLICGQLARGEHRRRGHLVPLPWLPPSCVQVLGAASDPQVSSVWFFFFYSFLKIVFNTHNIKFTLLTIFHCFGTFTCCVVIITDVSQELSQHPGLKLSPMKQHPPLSP